MCERCVCVCVCVGELCIKGRYECKRIIKGMNISNVNENTRGGVPLH